MAKKNKHPYWSKHNQLYPGGSPDSVEWKALKQRVKVRDGNRCIKCSSTELLHVDHITPLSKGGRNEMSNLQTLCKKCHEKKTGRPLYDWREGKKQFSRSSHTEFATPNRTSFNKPIEEAQLSTERAIWEAEKEIRAAERERLRILLDPTLQGYGSPNRKSTEAEASPSSYPVDSIMGEPFSQKMLPEKNRHAEQPILDQDNIDTTKLSILALGAQITPLTKYLVVLLLTIFGTLCILSFANYWTSFANAR